MQTQQINQYPVLKKREVASLALMRPPANQYAKQDTITTSGTTCGFPRHLR